MNILMLPYISVQNANALSSPFTIGFPAMTAWLGFVHALERKLNRLGFAELRLLSVAVVSHRCDVQSYKGASDYVHSIIGTGNPLDKDGTRSAFIEEARCHLDVTLLIEWSGNEDLVAETGFADQLEGIAATMKVAGGDILYMHRPSAQSIDIENMKETRTLLRKLMPGYVLIERRDLMISAMQQGADAIDALLSFLTINHYCEMHENGRIMWQSQRKTHGWIVPIGIGFQGISSIGKSKNQRDSSVPHRFAESVVTLGEFVMPYKIQHINHMFWHYQTDLENDLYLCQQVSAVNEFH